MRRSFSLGIGTIAVLCLAACEVVVTKGVDSGTPGSGHDASVPDDTGSSPGDDGSTDGGGEEPLSLVFQIDSCLSEDTSCVCSSLEGSNICTDEPRLTTDSPPTIRHLVDLSVVATSLAGAIQTVDVLLSGRLVQTLTPGPAGTALVQEAWTVNLMDIWEGEGLFGEEHTFLALLSTVTGDVVSVRHEVYVREPRCPPSTIQCLSETVLGSCPEAGTGWEEETCGHACVEDQCTLCPAGEERCNASGTHEVCREDGLQWVEAPCEYGCDTDSGECFGCPADVTTCDDDGLDKLICPSDGSEWEVEECLWGCADGECMCQAGAQECADSGTLRSCIDGGWETDTCTYGCTSGRYGSCCYNTYRCSPTNTNYRDYCHSGYGWYPNWHYCPYGCDEASGNCRTCSPGQVGSCGYMGSGNYRVQVCRSDGMGWEYKTCYGTCSC
jgi:hypothetical protein